MPSVSRSRIVSSDCALKVVFPYLKLTFDKQFDTRSEPYRARETRSYLKAASMWPPASGDAPFV